MAESFLKPLDAEQRRLIWRQNCMLYEFLRDGGTDDVPLSAISRDKFFDFVIFETQFDRHPLTSICASLVGKDKNGDFDLLPVGNVVFKTYFQQDDVYIAELNVEDEFQSFGIGTLLLKLVENIAIEKGRNRLTLLSALDISKLRSALPKVAEEEAGKKLPFFEHLEGEAAEKFKGCFDRNLYFYFSNGFDIDYEELGTKKSPTFVPMMKEKLRRTDLSFGAFGGTRLFRPTDPKFVITKTHLEKTFRPYRVFNDDPENAPKKYADFTPLSAKPEKGEMRVLKRFLEAETAKRQKS